ncbi:hypothetical protein HX99_05635 [Peptococcaceae bacterium SCADC1_2_3]|nr:hypothetical protein DK28_0201170 [Peptococcaceae bacterium SCADC1_2_3]KFI35627.1 hypothetical protein HX99_05635 [Peptococcaceae bacterium SCADC1_2_3]KFI37705.1 hypothetical protein HY02_04330 [Peptococcaceae bacterium SCADC1_2_3]
MHNIFLVCTSDFYYKNKIFDLNDPTNRDNFYFPYYLLRQKFLKFDISLNTYDYFNFDENCDEPYILIFFDIPKNINILLKYHKNIDKFLVIFESKVMSSVNWNRNLHKNFKKIFTWNDDFVVDGKKYIKYYWPNKIPEKLDFDLGKKNNLCTMIAGHKFKDHPIELYTERVKAIRWFEQNHPEYFDLYGIGWDKYRFKGALSILNTNRFEVLTKLLKPKYPSYRGTVKLKRDVLQKYKFAICYENARDIPGYITEKIFDCFFAGCVPVYWGAPNVTAHIPADTFIDRRKFRNYEELYSYLKNMPDKKYINYLDAIKSFIKSDKIYPFSAECFAETLINEIIKDLNG